MLHDSMTFMQAGGGGHKQDSIFNSKCGANDSEISLKGPLVSINYYIFAATKIMNFSIFGVAMFIF